jgi:hypothetical protein
MKFFIKLILLVLFLGATHISSAQLGVFTEFTIESSNEVTRLRGNLMDTNIGVQYRFLNSINLRAGVSKRSRKSIRGENFFKDFFDSSDPTMFRSESLFLSHSAVISGYSVFGGIETNPNRLLLGVDLHYQQSMVGNGEILANYSFSSATTFGTRDYNFPTKYEDLSFTKLSLRLGYAVYQKPRGKVTVFLNYSRDLSQNEILRATEFDDMIRQLVDDIPLGQNTSSSSFSRFINSGPLNYDQNYFSVGINISYFFNVEVEKPIGDRRGG